MGLVLQELTVQVPGLLAREYSGKRPLSHELLLGLSHQSERLSQGKTSQRYLELVVGRRIMLVIR